MDDDYIPLPLSVPTDPEPPRRSRRRVVFVVAGLGLVAAMAIAGYEVADFRDEGQTAAATAISFDADGPVEPPSAIHERGQTIDDSDAGPDADPAERD